MKISIRTAFILALLALPYLFCLAGCGEQKNVVDDSQKKGMTAEERKDKRGE